MKARDLASIAAFALLLATGAPDAFAQSDPTDLDLDGVPGLAEPPAEPFAPAPSILVGVGNREDSCHPLELVVESRRPHRG